MTRPAKYLFQLVCDIVTKWKCWKCGMTLENSEGPAPRCPKCNVQMSIA